MNESWSKNDSLILRNITADKPGHEQTYQKIGIPCIPHSKLKFLATNQNLDNWKAYSKMTPKLPKPGENPNKKDWYLKNKYVVMRSTREGVA